MKRLSPFLFLTLFFTFANNAVAQDLYSQRMHVVSQYVTNLHNADAVAMGTLFTSDGIVVANSGGKVDAREFYNGFLPLLSFSETTLKQRFAADEAARFAARFSFKFAVGDEAVRGGEYMDEFVFEKGSAKLKVVYMFENLAFEE